MIPGMGRALQIGEYKASGADDPLLLGTDPNPSLGQLGVFEGRVLMRS
jgi:hypothetical protein